MPRTKGRLRSCIEPGCNDKFRSFRSESLCKLHKHSFTYAAATIEDWFMQKDPLHRKIVSKIGIPVIFYVPEQDWVIVTLEAQQDCVGRNSSGGSDFHILVRSSLTPAYPVPLYSFLEKYDICIMAEPKSMITETDQKLDFLMTCLVDEDYQAIPRALEVMAIQAPVSGKLLTAWGSVLPFSKKNFILRYKEYDFAVIDPIVFAATYQ